VRPRAKRFALVLIVLALNVLALEAAVRFWVRDAERLRGLATGVDDPWWRLSWIHHRKTTGTTNYAIDEFHPTRGWALKPGLRDVELRGGRVSSNSRGVRGTREVATPKPPGTKRVLVFGDSFTFGEEVGDGQTYAARLEGLFPGVEFLNLGVHGYGHDQMLLYLRESVALYEPDVVILGYLHVDDVRNLLSFRDYAKPSFELVDGRLELRGVPVPTPEQVLAAETWRPKVLDLGELFVRQARWRWGGLKQETRELSDALLLAFAATAREHGATPLIVYMTLPSEVVRSEREPDGREKQLEELCRANGIPFLSLRRRFYPLRDRVRPRPNMQHWDAFEHRVAAQAIAAHLRETRLLDGDAAPASDGGA